MNNEPLTIYCDGGSRGNPGHAAYGFVVKEEGKTIHEGAGYIGIATNNFAEYTAIVEALKWLKSKAKGKDLKFNLDSQLVASQLSGLFKVKNPQIAKFVYSVKEMESSFGQISYNHIPRAQNFEPDRLVNLALDKHLGIKY